MGWAITRTTGKTTMSSLSYEVNFFLVGQSIWEVNFPSMFDVSFQAFWYLQINFWGQAIFFCCMFYFYSSCDEMFTVFDRPDAGIMFEFSFLSFQMYPDFSFLSFQMYPDFSFLSFQMYPDFSFLSFQMYPDFIFLSFQMYPDFSFLSFPDLSGLWLTLFLFQIYPDFNFIFPDLSGERAVTTVPDPHTDAAVWVRKSS